MAQQTGWNDWVLIGFHSSTVLFVAFKHKPTALPTAVYLQFIVMIKILSLFKAHLLQIVSTHLPLIASFLFPVGKNRLGK